MSLADACVVRMAEVHDRYDVLTLDSDFSVYRKHGRVPLTLIHPGGV
jgi:predicted nucleic acid-binding protein